MKLKRSVLFLSLILAAIIGEAGQPQISSYLVEGKNAIRMQKIADQFEIVKAHQNAYEVIVPENKKANFLKIAPQAKILVQDISEPVRQIFQHSQWAPLRNTGYHSFDDIVAMMNSLSLANAATTNLVQYGLSQKGKPLLALRVSNHLRDGKTVPRILLTAATHGDEIITTEVLLKLMTNLLEQQTTNPRFAEFLDKMEIVFVPVLNPDGFAEQNRYDNGEDPNRSYPFPENTTGAPTASINGIMNLIKTYPMAGSLDFHAYGRMIMYPWGYTRQAVDPEAEKTFAEVTQKMATTNSYAHGQISKVIYIAKGSSADYYFWKFNTFALAVEMGDSKAPQISALEKYTREQAESTWIFLDSFK